MGIVVSRNDAGHWCLSGTLDDLGGYESIDADRGHIVIDLRGVKSITSHGLRTWTQFLASKKADQIELVGCPAIFLDAVDMVVDMAPSGDLRSIKSCCFDYFCEECDKPASKEVARQDLIPTMQDLLTSGMPCPRCRLPMKAKDEIESYVDLFAAALRG